MPPSAAPIVTATEPGEVLRLLGRAFSPAALGGMTDDARSRRPDRRADAMSAPTSELIINALPLPVLTIGPDERILQVNMAAEHFFDIPARLMQRQRLRDIIPFFLADHSRWSPRCAGAASVSEYRVDLGLPRSGQERSVDVFATHLDDDTGCWDAPGAHHRRQDEPPAHPPAGGALDGGARRDARPRDQEPGSPAIRGAAQLSSSRAARTTPCSPG